MPSFTDTLKVNGQDMEALPLTKVRARKASLSKVPRDSPTTLTPTPAGSFLSLTWRHTTRAVTSAGSSRPGKLISVCRTSPILPSYRMATSLGTRWAFFSSRSWVNILCQQLPLTLNLERGY